LNAGSPLAVHLAAALAPGANPEDSDIAFMIMADGGAPLAKATFNLSELLESRSDANNTAIPMQALSALSPDSETVADLVITLKGAKAVNAACNK